MSLKYEHAKHAMPAVDHYEYQPLEQQCCQIKSIARLLFYSQKLFPADKNDVLRVWRKKILIMIIIFAMIILIKILVILMIMMTKNTEKPTNIVNFG